jgi:hypothetical protein
MLEQVETALEVAGFFKLIDSFPDIDTAMESLLEIDQDSE